MLKLHYDSLIVLFIAFFLRPLLQLTLFLLKPLWTLCWPDQPTPSSNRSSCWLAFWFLLPRFVLDSCSACNRYSSFFLFRLMLLSFCQNPKKAIPKNKQTFRILLFSYVSFSQSLPRNSQSTFSFLPVTRKLSNLVLRSDLFPLVLTWSFHCGLASFYARIFCFRFSPK